MLVCRKSCLTCLVLEFDFRRFLAAFLGFEIGFGVEAEDAGDDVVGEFADIGVVVSGHVVELFALDGYSVLSAFQLALEVEEVLIGLEVRVCFFDSHESAEGAAEVALRFLELCHGLLVEVAGVDCHACGFRAGLDDGSEGLALVGGVTFDCGDKIRDEVGSALVDVLDLCPLGLDGFLFFDHVVVSAAGEEHCREGCEEEDL